MAIEIIDNRLSLEIWNGDLCRDILKTHIKEVCVLGNNIVMIDLGRARKNVYIDWALVDVPLAPDASNLRDSILAMLRSQEVGLLTSLNTAATSTDDKMFYQPVFTDDSVPGTVYYGYCLAGNALPSKGVWAIQRKTTEGGLTKILWSGGKRTFDKVWDNRASYTYS